MEGKLGLGNKLKKVNPLDEVFYNKENDKLEEQLKNIPLEKLIHYCEHKFKLYTGQRKKDLIESIKSNGILTPIIVTPKEDKYMILAGHNRTECAREAGLKEIPSKILKNLTDAEEKKIVIETNLFQRSFSELPTSQKAEIIAEYCELKQTNGENITDIEEEIKALEETSPVGTESNTEKTSPVGTRKIGQEYSLSKNTIARLLRINKLINLLKDRVDNGEISIRVGVDLSYLNKIEQYAVEEIIEKHNIKIDMKKSVQLKQLKKNLTENQQLDEEDIKNILLASNQCNKDYSKKRKPIKVKTELVEKFFTPEQQYEQIQNIIEKALEQYFDKIKHNDSHKIVKLDGLDQYVLEEQKNNRNEQ